MTAVTGTELYAAEESLGNDWDDNDDLSDLVRQLDSGQMDAWGCVEVTATAIARCGSWTWPPP